MGAAEGGLGWTWIWPLNGCVLLIEIVYMLTCTASDI